MAERLWAYLITRAGHVPPAGTTGIRSLPVEALVEGPVCVWASPLDAVPAADLTEIRRHNELIQSATTESITPVPIRFGQVACEAALRGTLAARPAHWLERLDAFAGAAEFGLRVVAAQNVRPIRAASGRAFLEGIAARERRAEDVSAAVHDAVRALVRREWVESPADPAIVARLAHLVGAAEAPAYRVAVERVAERHPECRFQSSGPWPPYTFAA